MRINLIYALANDLAISAMENHGFLHVMDDNSVFWTEENLENAVSPFWIGREFMDVGRINEEDHNVLLGCVKIFKIQDLTWNKEDATLDQDRIIAELQFALPEGFQRTEENFLKYICGFTDQKFARPILNNLIMQTGADVL